MQKRQMLKITIDDEKAAAELNRWQRTEEKRIVGFLPNLSEIMPEPKVPIT